MIVHPSPVVILAAGRVRDERRRADSEHLRDGQHDEREVAGNGDCRHRFLPEPPNPVEVDEKYSVWNTIVTSMKLAVFSR
jgi:hypothetical protein